MKKILFFVLIAIIACSQVEQYEQYEIEDADLILEGINIRSLWNKFKNNASQAKQFLKSIGLYDPLIDLLKKCASYYALNYCTSKGFPQDICQSIVSFLSSLIK